MARGFQHGTAPGAVVVGWNSRHTAVTLPDGTPVSSGEGGGVRIGGGGAYQPQFTHHMFLPLDGGPSGDEPGPMAAPLGFDGIDAPPEPGPEPGNPPVELVTVEVPPADDAPAEPAEPAPVGQQPAATPV